MIPVEAIELKNRLNFALYSSPKPLPISPPITPDRIACRVVHRASGDVVHVVGWLVLSSEPVPVLPLITPDRIACRAVHRASGDVVHVVHVVGWLVLSSEPVPVSPLITPDRIACRAVHRASSGLVYVVGWLVRAGRARCLSVFRLPMVSPCFLVMGNSAKPYHVTLRAG